MLQHKLPNSRDYGVDDEVDIFKDKHPGIGHRQATCRRVARIVRGSNDFIKF